MALFFKPQLFLYLKTVSSPSIQEGNLQ